MLFVPGNRPHLIEKAYSLPSDAIVLDLEDSVPLNEKAAARESVRQNVPKMRSIGVEVYVRINSLSTKFVEEDLRAVVSLELAAIVVPKVQSAQEAQSIAALLKELETNGRTDRTALMFTIESCLGVMNAHQIAKGSDRAKGLIFGAVDYVSDLGVSLTNEVSQLLYARSHVAVAARAARIMAIDSVYPDFKDNDGLTRDTKLARQLGYGGKVVIHPDQIRAVNDVFTPAKVEVRFAERVIEAYREAQRTGYGAVSLDGRMVDDAVHDSALSVVNLVKAIQSIEKEKVDRLRLVRS